MNKLIYTFAFALLSLGIQAQCTPDTSIKKVGIYPSQLPHAIEDSMYSLDLQFKLISDTSTPFGNVHFDSIALLGIGNLPNFMDYKCNNDSGMGNCTWVGGANACLHLGGKPPVGSAGKYKLRVKLRGYFVIAGSPTFYEDSSTTRDFFVDAMPNGVQDVFNAAYHVSAQPNPFDQYTDIPFLASQNGLVTAKVFDCQGKEVMNKQQVAEAGKNAVRIDGKNLPAGVYHVAVSFGGQSGFVRIVRL